MTLSGFGTVKAGDTVFQDVTGEYSSIIIPNGDSRIGKTYWIFKDSKGQVGVVTVGVMLLLIFHNLITLA